MAIWARCISCSSNSSPASIVVVVIVVAAVSGSPVWGWDICDAVQSKPSAALLSECDVAIDVGPTDTPDIPDMPETADMARRSADCQNSRGL